MILRADLISSAEAVITAHREAGTRIALAESCTGGLVAAALTSVAGASDVFLSSMVTYSNEAKARALGVEPVLFELHGAVSGEVAAAMAEGALDRSGADRTVSVTGIAGPGGGSAEKPVGTVWFGVATPGRVASELRNFDPTASRDAIRLQAALTALSLLSPSP